MNNRLINTKVAGGGGCTDIVDNYDPFGGNGVALYQLNGDATDVSGNYNGTVVGSVSYETGVFGQAVYSNNSSGVVISSTIPNTSVQTLSFWLNISATYSDEVFIGSYTPYRPASGSPAVFVNTGSAVAVALPSIPLNQWNNIVLTVNNGSLDYYLNGSFVGSYSSGVNYIYWFNLLSGDTVVPNTHKLDQVRVFNTALTPLEVEALYTEELCICDGTVDTLDILGDGSCIATYQLDGNANDLSGNYSGTPTDVSYGVGEFDLAGVFNGSTSKFNFSSSMYNRDLSHTISLWLNPLSIAADKMIYWGGDENLRWNSNGTVLFKRYSLSAGNRSVNSTRVLSIGIWYHIVISYSNSSGMALYIDGQLEGTNSSTAIVDSTSGNYGIGYRVDNNTSYMNGSIDQVRIFNKALSAGEVTTLYNETACGINCTGSDLTDYYFNGVQTSSITCFFDLYMSPDGTKMYVIKDYGNTISQYTLNTPYSVSSSTFVRDRTSTNTTPIVGLQFKPDGTKMYVYSNAGVAALQEFTLSTAWDISTASLTTTINTSGQVGSGNGLGLFIKPDGTKFYLSSAASSRIYQYSMGSAWTLSGASYDSIQSPVFAEIPRSVHITNDGSKLFCGIGGPYQYDLTTAWDITSLVYKETLTSSPYTDCMALHLNDDEDKMYVLNAQNSIYELELTCTPN